MSGTSCLVGCCAPAHLTGKRADYEWIRDASQSVRKEIRVTNSIEIFDVFGMISMPQTVGQVPTPLSLVELFFEHCREMGWITGEFLDFVKHDDKYYCFVWVKSSYQERIPEILMDNRSSILEEGGYGIRRLNYRALIFQDPPPPSLVSTVAGNSRLSERVAVYDLSPLYRGDEVCRCLNGTGTLVYHEFEDFLRRRYSVTFVSLEPE